MEHLNEFQMEFMDALADIQEKLCSNSIKSE